MYSRRMALGQFPRGLTCMASKDGTLPILTVASILGLNIEASLFEMISFNEQVTVNRALLR
jgi:hypothetical protein